MRRWVLSALLVALAGCGWLRGDDGPPADRRCETADKYGCFVLVPGGTFLMGAQATDPAAPGYDPAAAADEGPPHEVTLSPYWIMREEHTASQYGICVGDGACRDEDVSTGGYSNHGRPERRGHPLNAITWEGARRACAFADGRLPTEAEWELAARGADGRRWPWGDDPGCGITVQTADGTQASIVLGDDRLMQQPPCRPDGTVAVRDVRGASPYGVRGLAGNVWEWVADGYGPYAAGPARDPTGPASATLRVQRGGGWTSDDPLDLRSAARMAMGPDEKVNDVGFRCVWSPK